MGEKYYNELIKQIQAADIAYYQNDNPIMSDKQYDELYDKIEKIERETGIVLAGSPTQKVQGYVLDGFEKVTHSKPMLSAAKTKDINEIKKFLGANKWYCSGKLDGATLVIIFENGEFVRGITRGNGIIGEDVTAACKFIKNLPMRIPYKERLEIRGECVMSWDEFNRINENIADKYSHPRNLAAGTLRQLDLNIVKERELSFVVFECVTDIYESKLQELNWLSNIGFETVIRMGQDVGSVDEVTELMTKDVQSNKYPYDGLVFEIDSNIISKHLGKTAHHESCRMALKWADETYETVLRDVEWNTGKSGVLFPTGIVNPVDLDGAITSRVTLHNISYIKGLELGIGDTVTIYRSNMVIPAIDDNLTRSNTLQIPKVCPICGSPTKIVKDNDSEALYCTNDDCPGRLLGKLTHFVSKKGMDIDGLSEQTLKTFIRMGWLHSLGDIYLLNTYEDGIKRLDGFGPKSVKKLLDAIERSTRCDLTHFLSALSIPGIGLEQSKVITAKFPTSNDLLAAVDNHYQFSQLPGIGAVLERNIFDWFDNNRSEYVFISSVLVFDDVESGTGKLSDVLNGLVFVITGSLESYPNRDALKSHIESLGGKVAGSVSKNTSYLINNDVNSTSGKNKKAKDLGVPIISEQDFLKMIAE